MIPSSNKNDTRGSLQTVRALVFGNMGNMHCPDHVAAVRLAAIVSLSINLLLVLVKVTAGTWGNSKAVFADGIHSLADVSSSLLLLVGVRYWSAPADDRHPHGHRRIETFVALAIGCSLALVALCLLLDAIRSWPSRHVAPGMAAVLAAVASVILNYLLYRWILTLGICARSPAVLANARENKADAFSSLPTVVTVAVASFAGDAWSFLDHVGAVMVCMLIMKTAWDTAYPAFSELTDKGAPPSVRTRIKELVLAVPDIRSVHAVRSRYMGPGLCVDLHIEVDPDMTISQGHALAEIATERLKSADLDVVDVVVHIEPHG